MDAQSTMKKHLAALVLAICLLGSACGPLLYGIPVPQPPRPAPPTPAPAPRVNNTHAGYITQDEIWRGEFLVTGDIWVRPGVTLTIEPGTTVRITANRDEHNLFHEISDLRMGLNNGWPLNGVRTGEPFRDEQHHVSIRVDGRLVSDGQPASTGDAGSEPTPVFITITSDSPDPTPYDWNRLTIASGRIAYTLIEYYRILETLTDDVDISFGVLRHAGECAVCAYSNVNLSAMIIFDAGHALVEVAGNPVISDSVLAPNAPPRECVHVIRGQPIIMNSELDERCKQ